MKKLFFLFGTIAWLAGMYSCTKNNSAPPVSNKPAALGQKGAIVSIDTLRKAYGDTDLVLDNYKITGIVISSAASKNFPAGYVIIQKGSRGITLGLDSITAAGYSTGDSLVIDITGATLTNVTGTLLLKAKPLP